MYKKLLNFLKPHGRDIWLSALCSSGESLFALWIPFVMAKIMDHGVSAGDLGFTIRNGLLMTVMALFVVVFGVFSMKFATRAGLGLGTDLRSAAYRKMQTFTFQNLEKFGTASLITRLTTDITTIQTTTIQAIKYLVRAPSMMLFAAVFSFMISPKLAWMFIALIPVVLIIVLIIILKLRPRFFAMQQCIDHLNQVVQENIIAQGIVKAFCRQEHQKNIMAESNDRVMIASDRAMGLSILTSPLGNFVLYMGTILLYWYGGRDVILGNLTIGQLSGLTSYLTELLSRVLMMANLSVMFSRSMVSFHRLLEVIETEPEICDGPGTLPVQDGSISFRDVEFGYAGSPVLMKNLNLSIPSGQTVGIIGGTGSGKSTLVSLIPRLYDISGGELRVGGNSIEAYTLGQLRDEIAFVPQTSTLFSGSIRDNLLWARADATEEEIREACIAACAHGFISQFPEGYDTRIGQGGSTLSGGQRQRLCIARAILKQPKILILDDATSAVDMATDASIRASFRTLLPGVTKLIIAQRISSVAYTDRILVMDKGKIVGDGTHEELLETCQIYRELCDLQHYGEEAEYA
ncbi:MAG: ABC transporter ATP-binding protein [Oscillospiraceae bacterium]|nr:ABC transporter ATP-binding protein [Oscillospiraceae bacterium]